uniref:General secretion pathway protein E n=1 Tax=uncultured Desulfobacterium sp. TaxID=201089 RepID=E1YCT5_9BACT|nr:General secretion pathway protein E [uncultured Desulfobacterium sp.]
MTEEQLNNALDEQKNNKLKLGQFLIRRGIISEDQMVDLLGRQLKIRKYHPDLYPFDIELSQLISIEHAQRYRLVPLNKKGRLLTVAMLDPMDINAMDFIESTTDCEVEVVICAEREFNNLISGLYGIQSGISGILENINIETKVVTEKEEEEISQDLQLAYLQDMAGEAPVIRIVNSIFVQAIREGASDIHISPQQDNIQVRFRIDGKLHEVPSPSKSMFLPIAARIKILSNVDVTVTRVPQDGRFTLRMENKEINVRASFIPIIYGENIVLRLLDTSAGVYSLDRLGINKDDIEKIRAVILKPYGMILSTGPTGSGKSTSVYALLNELNSPDSNIMTLEDPVEYRIQNIRQVQLNSKAGMTFASGLRSILRQDPDIIMVGEIRDAETAAIAVQAAQTGHRVLSTVHTNNSVGAITRFIDMGIEPFLLSSTLLMCIAQRLVRTVCPYCRESYSPPEKVLTTWGVKNWNSANFQRGKGCNQCLNTGYKGRTGIFEVLICDEMVRDMIIRKSAAHEITRKCIEAGTLKTLQYDAGEKALKGITTLEEAGSAVIM